RRLGDVEDLDAAVADLDLAGGQVGVRGALGPMANGAGDAHHVLAADVDRSVDDALDDAGVVAQIDEREVLAVLAPAADPPAQRHRPADVVGAEVAAPIGAHRRLELTHDSRLLTRSITSARGTCS